MSARLAELGFTASLDALEHPQGFLSAVSPEGEVDRESPAHGLGSEWRIVKYRLGIKKYPACYCTHRALDAMLELLARQPLQPAEIARITVSLSDTHALILRNHQPQTGLAAKFSIEFAMAAAVIARRAGLAEYTDELCPPPRGSGADAPGRDRDQSRLRSRGLRRLGLRPGTRRAGRRRVSSKARRWRGRRAMPTGR